MQIFWWFFTLLLAIVAAGLINIRDELRDLPTTAVPIELVLGDLIYYADRLVWVGAMLSLYPLINILKRVPRHETIAVCVGPWNAIFLALSLLTALAFAASFGLVLMAFPWQIEGLPEYVHWIYAGLFAGAGAVSFCYVVRLQALLD